MGNVPFDRCGETRNGCSAVAGYPPLYRCALHGATAVRNRLTTRKRGTAAYATGRRTGAGPLRWSGRPRRRATPRSARRRGLAARATGAEEDKVVIGKGECILPVDVTLHVRQRATGEFDGQAAAQADHVVMGP